MSKNITKQSIHTDSIQSLPAYASIQRNKSYSLMKTRKPHRTSLTDWWGLLLKESTRKLPKIVGQPYYHSAGFVCCFGRFFPLLSLKFLQQCISSSPLKLSEFPVVILPDHIHICSPQLHTTKTDWKEWLSLSQVLIVPSIWLQPAEVWIKVWFPMWSRQMVGSNPIISLQQNSLDTDSNHKIYWKLESCII